MSPREICRRFPRFWCCGRRRLSANRLQLRCRTALLLWVTGGSLNMTLRATQHPRFRRHWWLELGFRKSLRLWRNNFLRLADHLPLCRWRSQRPILCLLAVVIPVGYPRYRLVLQRRRAWPYCGLEVLHARLLWLLWDSRLLRQRGQLSQIATTSLLASTMSSSSVLRHGRHRHGIPLWSWT